MSISEETCIWVVVVSAEPSPRLVNSAVTPRVLRKSTKRSIIECTSPASPALMSADIGIDDNSCRLKITHVAMHGREMGLQAIKIGSPRAEFEQLLVDPFCQVEADGTHIPNDLLGRFLHGEIDAAFARRADRIGKMRGDGRLSAARHAGNQDTRTFEISFALQHRIEIGNAARNTLGRSVMREPADVIGITVMPCWSMMNGYSLVPCAEPRYLTSRRRRVDS